jgi:hypothetical protein
VDPISGTESWSHPVLFNFTALLMLMIALQQKSMTISKGRFYFAGCTTSYQNVESISNYFETELGKLLNQLDWIFVKW